MTNTQVSCSKTLVCILFNDCNKIVYTPDEKQHIHSCCRSWKMLKHYGH